MMESVFKKSDFLLCDVPVPKGYPQSQTHCTIKQYNGDYYLTTSPYPAISRPKWKGYLFAILKRISLGRINKLYIGEDFENPCIYKGEISGQADYPVIFRLLEGSPLMEKPDDLYGLGSYCSDPDLYIENDMFYILNRSSVRKSNTGDAYKDYETKVYLIEGKPSDGIFIISNTHYLYDSLDASPCIAKYNNDCYLLSLESTSYNTGAPCKALNVRKREGTIYEWSNPSEIQLDKGCWEPWHMSVFSYDSKLYAIVACVEKGVGKRCWQILGEFNEDLSCLKLFQKPLTDYCSYRSSAVVTEKGEFVLYNTTVREKIKGSKSVDGREVLMAHKPFSQLIEELS